MSFLFFPYTTSYFYSIIKCKRNTQKEKPLGIHAASRKLIAHPLIQDLSETEDSDVNHYVNAVTITVDEYATEPTLGLIRTIM